MTIDRERLAVEHVIGLLEGDERHEAERLVTTDPDFAAMTRIWEERLFELDATAPSIRVEEAFWRRIESGLDALPPAVPVDDPGPVDVPHPLEGFRDLWRSLRFWRTAGITATLASLALAMGLGALGTQQARQPVLVAVLMTQANQPAALINAFADGRAELVPIGNVEVPRGRAFEIWTFPDPQGGPVSLGILTQARTATLDLGRMPRADQVFAVSVEPPTGSPTGAPSGPMMMKGTAASAL